MMQAADKPSTLDFDVHAVADLLERSATESGLHLVDLIAQQPALLVFLRHAGCTFCREALADIAKARHDIEARGTKVILIYMGDREAMLKVTQKYNVSDLDRIADPDRALYSAFGLNRGTFRQLFGWKVWWRGVIAGLWNGHGRGTPSADYRQMPGVFLVDKGLIARHFRHRSAADRPEYDSLCTP